MPGRGRPHPVVDVLTEPPEGATLVATIGVADLAFLAYVLRAQTFGHLESLTLTYVVVNFPVARPAERMGRRLPAATRRETSPMPSAAIDPTILLLSPGVAVAAGGAGGILAGLLGVGGGIVIVPAPDLAPPAADLGEGTAMQVAVRASLATIVLAAPSSARAHRRHGAVDVALPRLRASRVVAGSRLGAVVDGRVMVAGRPLAPVMRDAGARHHERRHGPGPAPHLAQGAAPLLGPEEVRRQQAGACVDRPFWRDLDAPPRAGAREACGPGVRVAGASIPAEGSTPPEVQPGWASASTLTACPPRLASGNLSGFAVAGGQADMASLRTTWRPPS